MPITVKLVDPDAVHQKRQEKIETIEEILEIVVVPGIVKNSFDLRPYGLSLLSDETLSKYFPNCLNKEPKPAPEIKPDINYA